MKPLAIDLFCGLGGWTEGLLAERYHVIGFDIEQHAYGDERYPAHLVIQDVKTLHGSQFRHASLIVASPPCQEFSYMAMPWGRAKQIARALRGQDEFPDGYKGSRTIAELTALFDACFRIQREASEAAGHRIPMVVENVKGAQPWVGPAAWNFGSYYLWGDVPALMPHTISAQKFNPDGTQHGSGSWFAIADSKNCGTKNTGGSWFNIAHNTASGVANNPVSVPADGRKSAGLNWSDRSKHGQDFTRVAGRQADIGGPQHEASGIKQGGSWFHDNASASRMHSSKSPARKAASAKIAKIPFALSSHIARVYKPATAVASLGPQPP